ncbi:MAG: hypothetical protein RR682_11205, partial [Cetobacterium sp.]
KFIAKRNEEKIGELFYEFGNNSNLIVYQSWFLAGEDEIKIEKHLMDNLAEFAKKEGHKLILECLTAKLIYEKFPDEYIDIVLV